MPFTGINLEEKKKISKITAEKYIQVHKKQVQMINALSKNIYEHYIQLQRNKIM